MTVDNNAHNDQAVPLTDDLSKRDGELMSIRNLRVWFELRRFGFGHAGYVHAVDGVNFDLPYGAAVAIVGESGSGKTTLMRTLLGLYRPTGGEVIFQGNDLTSYSGKDMKWYHSQVGYIQQDPYGALPPFMNVSRILTEPMVIHGIKSQAERTRRMHKALEEVKMTPVEEFLSKFPHMLSGGQQQRVVIARAIILEPKVLIADEPVSMLDASVRVEILKLLRGLQESRGLAVIYITHDLSTVRYFSERIFVMYAGQLVERAKVADLLNDYKHPYTHALLEATSDPDAANATKYRDVPPGEPPSLVNPPTGCRFHPRCARIIPGLCDKEEPPEFEPTPAHFAKCWLYK